MFPRHQVTYLLVILAFVLGLLGACSLKSGRPPQVSEISVQPSTTILVGETASLTIKASGTNLQFKWTVSKGSLSSTTAPSALYTAPDSPGPDTVAVEVIGKGGSTVQGAHFNVVASPTLSSNLTPTETPAATPTPMLTAIPTSMPTSTNTPTPTPTATPIPTPKPDAAVNTELLNLRSGPGTYYDTLGVLREGDPLKVMGRNLADDWLKVIVPDGQEGWVARSLLQVNVDMADVPVAQAPPTPTPMYAPSTVTTPTPELLPPPIPLEPENGASFIGGPVILKWQWDSPRAPNEVFSVRVRREGETRLCHHAQAKDLEYKGSLSYCTAGNHYWGVALVRDLAPWLPEDDENRWQDLSEPSDERWIYYTPGEEPWTWPTPESDEEDEGGGGGGPGWRP